MWITAAVLLLSLTATARAQTELVTTLFLVTGGGEVGVGPNLERNAKEEGSTIISELKAVGTDEWVTRTTIQVKEACRYEVLSEINDGRFTRFDINFSAARSKDVTISSPGMFAWVEMPGVHKCQIDQSKSENPETKNGECKDTFSTPFDPRRTSLIVPRLNYLLTTYCKR